MSDITDKLFDNDDLLSILDSGNKSEIEVSLGGELVSAEEMETNQRFEELRGLSENIPAHMENLGSGDLDTDLNNWFNGVDKLPSSPLSENVNSPMIKMDYGITRNTMSNFTMMGDLRKFLESSIGLLFNADFASSLTEEDLQERFKLAFTVYEKLYAQNQRTVMSLKDYKLKTNGVEDETDQMRMLISSIPKDKLKLILSELSK